MHQKSLAKSLSPTARRLAVFSIALLVTLNCLLPALAQQSSAGKKQKLPSPEKIVGDYLKAIGGKKRVAAVKDATYEWKLEERGAASNRSGKAATQLKAPASTRTEISYLDERIAEENAPASESTLLNIGANGRSAWIRDASGQARTLTDAQAQTAKLQAMLDATHLVDYKKSNVLARTLRLEEVSGEPAYLVEFSLRNGARLRYWFGASSKLLLATQDESRKIHRAFKDYRAGNGLLEPHQISWRTEDDAILTLNLLSVRYNTGLADALFDPPGAEAIDIGALLREVDRNQEQLEERVGNYTYTETRTERKINGRGEVTAETVRVFEIYPIPNRDSVRKLVSENGAPVSAEKAAKEEKRVTEELEKAQRERERAALKREQERLKGKPEKEEDDIGIGDFLRATEMVSPRRERLREREAIVFDFRPRAGYKPRNSTESIVSKLSGIMWIDPVDKQVMRLEARLVESYKMGGGLLASVRPGTAFVFEQKRMEDGVWLPVFAQVNISAKVLLFKGIDVNIVQEFSNYQRFGSSFDDYKLAAPEDKSKPSSEP